MLYEKTSSIVRYRKFCDVTVRHFRPKGSKTWHAGAVSSCLLFLFFFWGESSKCSHFFPCTAIDVMLKTPKKLGRLGGQTMVYELLGGAMCPPLDPLMVAWQVIYKLYHSLVFSNQLGLIQDRSLKEDMSSVAQLQLKVNGLPSA